MILFTGSPGGLKTAFFGFIKNNKKDPFDKALVVLPSRRLEAVLKREAAETLGALSAVYFTDFLKLALDITAPLPGFKPLLPNTYKQDFIIKDILRKYGAHYTRGYCGALKSTFRDLAAAQITVRDIINLKNDETLLSPEQGADIAKTAVFYNDYIQALKTPGFSTYYETFETANQNAAQSAYLKDFKHIVFYGFYDFTALQFELFKTINANYGCAVFFPYENCPGYKFVKSFYESNILPLARETVKEEPQNTPLAALARGLFDPGVPPVQNASVKIISVAGERAELEAAAKEILLLKEKDGVDFKDIALAARSFEPYKNHLTAVMEQNLIPVNFSFETPLVQTPLGAFIFNLCSAARNNFYKDDVLAALSSPYFKNRDESWQGVIKSIGVSAGYAQWADLLALAKDKEAASKLAGILEGIKNLLVRLEAPAPFSSLCASAEELLERYLAAARLNPAEENILFTVKDILAQIESFKDIRQNAERGEFLDEFLGALKEKTVNTTSDAPAGVTAADIMALRGQTFKAVVVLGLNEGRLPAAPGEDPVLKDVYRQHFQNLGFLMRRQADRYDEEKLLFNFAVQSAGEKLTLISQRAGDDGKAKIPSLYLSRILNLTGQSLAENNIAVVSRRPFEKYKQWPFELLTRNEAALLVGAEQKNKAAALCKINGIDGVSPAALVYEAAAALNSARTLTPFDGVVRPGNALASQLKERGISPSDLMVFLKCPARYLFGKITGGDEESFERAAVSPRRRGTFYHEILESFYKHLKTRGLFDKLSPAGAAQMLKDFLQTALSWQDYKKYGLYPLVWQVLREEFGAYLEHFAEEDFKLLEGGAFVPELFEESFETQITLNSKTLKLRGKLDRVDISGDGKSYRIIDYKTKRESAEIKKAVFRKAALQPPLYFEMAKNHPALKEKTPVAACLFGIETLGAINKDLPYDVYLALRPHFIQMLEYILEMIDDGVFLITPGENNCPGCRFETACRKAHHPTLRRSKTAGAAKKLGEYRAKY